jgi:hypothetical protein
MTRSDKSNNFPFVQCANEQFFYQYSPRSDFSISLKGLPILLLEVSSEPHLEPSDLRRLLLQAACALRLGHAFCVDSGKRHVVKAIYIDPQLRALEHTLFLPDASQDAQKVIFRVLFSHCQTTRH